MLASVRWTIISYLTSPWISAAVTIVGGTVIYFVGRTLRRSVRRLSLHRNEALAFKVHEHWREIVRGEIPADTWIHDRAQKRIVLAILIQEIGVASPAERPRLQNFLRANGLIEFCINQMHTRSGTDRRRAIQNLGAMRVPEAIQPLSEALDDWKLDVRMAAVQALGRTGLPEAGEPIIESLVVGALKVPADVAANALMHCYADHPEAILPYLRRSHGASRILLSRVASELATAAMADEMILLAGDAHPEVRAAAARGLAAAPLPAAIPVLTNLTRDEMWFVRLRAATALGKIGHPRGIPSLLQCVCDSNRLVRTRAAAALSRFEADRLEIVQNVVDSQDRYALQSLVSALELAGGLDKVMRELSDPLRHDATAAHLLEALREGAAAHWSVRPADPVVESVFP